MTPALLLLLGALAVPAQARSDSLERLQQEHASLADSMLEKVAEIRSLKEAYPRAADRDRALAQRRDLLKDLDIQYKRLEAIRAQHRRMIKTLVSAAFSRAITKVVNKEYYPDAGAARLLADDSAGTEMKERTLSVYATLTLEREAFDQAWAARQAELARRRHVRIALGAAAVFILLVVGIIAPWRREPALNPAPAPPPEAPALLAENFLVGELLGRGAMGEVFAAMDKTLNRRVALKRLRPELLAEPKDRERFLAEARLVAGLKHPNIVAIHSVAQEGDETCLVFEFVEGKTLEALLREKGRLPFKEALSTLRGVCSALSAAHEKGVIHRDLKPSNIMLSAEGAVKVMDFGIAHQARVSAARATRAASMGTPPYMAPEQELGSVSAAVDLYAASVCFYEMLTGRLPFSGPNFLAQKREEVYQPASALAPDLPEGIDAFFRSALAAQASARPADSAALYAAAAGSARP